MKYTWTYHAASERLPQRSGFTQSEIEVLLEQRKCVVQRNGGDEEHHLIWDSIKGHLIDVPVILNGEGVIPSILPVTYGSGYAEWRRAEAERAWRGDDFYKEQHAINGKRLAIIDVVLAKTWIKQSGSGDHRDLFPVLTWFIFDPEIAKHGDEGVLALYRDRAFCRAVKTLLQEWESDLPTLTGGDTPAVHIKKPGAHRIVPVEFFLSTP
jgi:hypothetical protein